MSSIPSRNRVRQLTSGFRAQISLSIPFTVVESGSWQRQDTLTTPLACTLASGPFPRKTSFRANQTVDWAWLHFRVGICSPTHAIGAIHWLMDPPDT